MAMLSIDICIATFRRPELLAALLSSLETQVLPVDLAVRVIVVDNDAGETARAVVTTHCQGSRFQVLYAVEPVQNIALARNRGVALAEGDYIAFIDDDEQAAPDWLTQLLATRQRFEADVVFGAVEYRLPPQTPPWIKHGSFFAGPRHNSGTVMSTGGFGNVLIRGVLLRTIPGPCNESFGLSGGEDHELFTRLRLQGARLVWCNEAVVWEQVGVERVRISYLARRALRSGQAFAAVTLKRLSPPARIIWFTCRLVLFLLAVMAMPVGCLLRFHWGARSLMKACANLGQLSALFGFRYRHYAG